MTPATAKKALAFLARVNLTGEEVPGYVEVHNALTGYAERPEPNSLQAQALNSLSRKAAAQARDHKEQAFVEELGEDSTLTHKNAAAALQARADKLNSQLSGDEVLDRHAAAVEQAKRQASPYAGEGEL